MEKDCKHVENEDFERCMKCGKDMSIKLDSLLLKEQQISGQIIEPCKDCGKIYCENVINGKCLGDISNLDYCVLCKAGKN